MLDIRRFCSEFRIPFIESGHHHCHQGWVQLHCPFCTNGNHGWHLGFSLSRGNWNCWRCGSHRLWDTVGKLLRDPPKDRLARVLAQFDTRPQVSPAKSISRKAELPPPPGLGPLGKPHRKYLRSRGLDPDALAETWGLQATSHLSGEWNWRVIAPIRDQDGQTVCYTGRALHPDTRPKYKDTDAEDILVEPRSLLYGIDQAEDSVLIVEGPADAWRMGPGAVAVLGIDWKTEQALQLKDFPRRFVMFDPGAESQAQAQKLADWLALFDGDTEIIEGLASDPGGLPQDEADGIMANLRISRKSP